MTKKEVKFPGQMNLKNTRLNRRSARFFTAEFKRVLQANNIEYNVCNTNLTILKDQCLLEIHLREHLFNFFLGIDSDDFFFFNFLLYIGVLPVNNVIVSGGQQRDSPICIHVSILLQTPLPSRLPRNNPDEL